MSKKVLYSHRLQPQPDFFLLSGVQDITIRFVRIVLDLQRAWGDGVGISTTPQLTPLLLHVSWMMGPIIEDTLTHMSCYFLSLSVKDFTQDLTRSLSLFGFSALRYLLRVSELVCRVFIGVQW